jgi:hypothetical protein
MQVAAASGVGLTALLRHIRACGNQSLRAPPATHDVLTEGELGLRPTSDAYTSEALHEAVAAGANRDCMGAAWYQQPGRVADLAARAP